MPTTFSDLAVSALRSQVDAFVSSAPNTRSADPEALHAMRVAARRLRAGLALFERCLPPSTKRLRGDLRWLARLGGKVRDLDVQIDQINQIKTRAGTGTGQQAWNEILGALHRRRTRARSDLASAIDSDRYHQIVAFLDGVIASVAPLDLPAFVAVPPLIDKRQQKAWSAAQQASRSGRVTDFHRVRIACKRLRYCLEFVNDLYAKNPSDMIGMLSELQDRLGSLQDSVVALASLKDIDYDRSPATERVLEELRLHHRGSIARLVEELPGELSAIDGPKWRRLRKYMHSMLTQCQ